MKKKKKTHIEKIAKALKKIGYGIVKYELDYTNYINDKPLVRLEIYKLPPR